MSKSYLFWTFPLIAAATMAGCAMDNEPAQQDEGVTEARGPIGKADLVGTCGPKANQPNFCGGKSKGNCWCDDECTDYGDCCADIDQYCGSDECPDANDPNVKYASHNPQQCTVILFHCEPGWEYFGGDCGCGCQKPVEQTCGGFLGQTCPSGQYCDYDGNSCGFADQSGVCKETPDACIQLYDPVCGCNGKTYSNSCVAASAGVDVKHDGACIPNNCGTGCGAGEYCTYCWGSYACIPEGALC